MNPKTQVQRYSDSERVNHWIVAIAFILAGLSGLSMFHPALFWLSNLFGGGPWTRILHPFIGVVMFAAFLSMMLRFWNYNKIEDRDWRWLKQWRDVVNNRGDKLPAGGRSNAAHKGFDSRHDARYRVRQMGGEAPPRVVAGEDQAGLTRNARPRVEQARPGFVHCCACRTRPSCNRSC